MCVLVRVFMFLASPLGTRSENRSLLFMYRSIQAQYIKEKCRQVCESKSELKVILNLIFHFHFLVNVKIATTRSE